MRAAAVAAAAGASAASAPQLEAQTRRIKREADNAEGGHLAAGVSQRWPSSPAAAAPAFRLGAVTRKHGVPYVSECLATPTTVDLSMLTVSLH